MKSLLPSEARAVLLANSDPLQINMIPDSDDSDFMSIQYHSGPLKASSLVMERRAVTIVDGDLTIENGFLDDSGLFDDFSYLVVLGNLRCRNFISTSAVYVDGNLEVSELLYYDSFGECTLEVQGSLQTKAFALNQGDELVQASRMTTDTTFSVEEDEDLQALRAMLLPDFQELFDRDLYGQFFQQVTASKTIFCV